MTQFLKWTATLLLIGIIGYYALGYLSSYIGYDGYKKWKYRKHSNDIAESKKRGMFVKELNFKVEGYSGDLNNFKPFIEKGFRWGRHTSEVTEPLRNSNYPYQLSFNYRPTSQITVLVSEQDIKKFDSTSGPWGYLKQPNLPDTIRLNIMGENIPPDKAFIKVW